MTSLPEATLISQEKLLCSSLGNYYIEQEEEAKAYMLSKGFSLEEPLDISGARVDFNGRKTKERLEEQLIEAYLIAGEKL